MLTGAVTADPFGVLAAFGAGILSFLSPCVLPLVPGYLSMVSGLSAAELGESRPRQTDPHGAAERREALVGAAAGGGAVATIVAPPPTAVVGPAVVGPAVGAPEEVAADVPAAGSTGRPLAPLVRGILLFIAGFTVVFVALGATASGVGQALGHHKDGLITASGAVVVVLGVVLLVGALPAGAWARLGPRVSARAGWLVGERRIRVRPEKLGPWAAPVMGMAFAFAWTPCIGPVLGAVLALAETRSTLGGGVVLLLAYSLGLGVPFLVTGIAFDRLTGFYARARRRLALVEVVAGLVLVAFGVLLIAGDLAWLSAQFSTLLNDLGLQRLATS